MNLNFVLFLIPFFFCPTIKIYANQTNLQEGEKSLRSFNQNLELLESKLRISDYKTSCLLASQTAKLIKNEIAPLKYLEPNYDWKEIRKVLLKISTKYCNGNKKK